MAARGDRKRALWILATAAALLAGGIGSSIFVHHQYERQLAERVQAEAAAAHAGRAPAPGPDSALLRREIRVIPYLLHIFTFGGCVLLLVALGALRGWRFFDPVAEQPLPPKLK